MIFQSFQSTKFALALIVILGLLGFLFYRPDYHIPTLTAILSALGGYFTGRLIEKKNNKQTP